MKSEQIPHIVDDLMTADLIALAPEDAVGRARELMLGLGISAIPVMEADEIVGIVTSSDLVEEWPDGEPVATVMSRAVRRIDREATLSEAAEIMRSEAIHHLVVADGSQVAGILSSFDLLAAFIPTMSRRTS